MDDKLIFLLLLSTCATVTWSAMAGTHMCETVTGSPNSFKLTVRLGQGGNTAVLGLTFFNAEDTDFSDAAAEASVDPACITSTFFETDIFQLQFTVDTDISPLPCGIFQVGADVYNVAYRADPDQSFFHGFCDLNDLLDTTVTSALFQPGNIDPPFFEIPHSSRSLQMRVVLNGGDIDIPIDEIQLGRKLRIKVAYKRGGTEDDARTTWSYTWHTGFLQSNDIASVYSLQLVTRGPMGTRVQITGQLPGFVIDEEIDVPVGTVTTVVIDSQYSPTSTANDWKKETKGIKIVALDSAIGVVSTVTADGTFTGAFTAFPDELLGTSYRLEGIILIPSGRALIVATEDTSVTIVFESASGVPAGLMTVGGETAVLSTVVSMAEYDVIDLACNDACSLISVSADKNFAVISGSEYIGGIPAFVSQMPPISTYGSKFVFIVPPVLSNRAVVFKASSPTSVGPTQNQIEYGTSLGPQTITTLADDTGLNINGVAGTPSAFEAVITQPTNAVPYMASIYSIDPEGFYTVPAISQWGPFQYIPLLEGMSYDVYIVSTTAALGAVTDSVDGRLDSLGYTAIDVYPADGGAVDYQMYVHSIATVTTSSLRKLSAPDPTQPFMAVVFANSASSGSQAFLPFGVGYPFIIPCTSTLDVGSVIGAITGNDVYSQAPGDGLDNDCDGLVDEESNDGIDNDLDGLVDEDTAVVVLDAHADVHGAYVDELFACDTAACDNYNGKIISGGCNIAPAGSSANEMSSFEKDSDLVAANSNYWVVQTSAFPAFRYRTQQKVHFRAKVKWCYDATDALCVNSCVARRRRDVTNDTESEWLSFSINVIDPEFEDPEPKVLEHPCLEDAGYWGMVSAFLVVIAIEVAAFVVVRVKLSSVSQTFKGI